MKQSLKSPTERLIEERNRLSAELTELQNKIRGLELAIGLLNDEAGHFDAAAQRTSGTTAAIRQLLEEAGPVGVTPQTVVERAAQRGQTLSQTSVSSILSRMKRDGEVVYRKRHYVLNFAKERSPLE